MSAVGLVRTELFSVSLSVQISKVLALSDSLPDEHKEFPCFPVLLADVTVTF